jgi:hypothetical protein
MRFSIAIALLVATPAYAGPWQFGDSVDLHEEAPNWSEISVINRPVRLAESPLSLPARVSVDWDGWTPPKVEFEWVATSELFEQPETLADIRDGGSWDKTLDRYGFWDAVLMDNATPGLGGPDEKDLVRLMFCTVYYTPLEEGFTAEKGFDMTKETRSGLGGRYYSKDFLRAVVVEGFGRLAGPYRGNRYIKYDGRWGYANRILGNRNNTLVDRKSAAVYRRNPALPKNTKLTILDPDVFNTLGSLEWNTADTGGGLTMWQIDLYWGEDYPLGTGMDRFRPAGCPFAIKFWLPVRISKP